MPKFAVSDHCDGEKFFNPESPENPGFLKTFRMLRTVKMKPWPKWVENKPALNLEAALSADEVAITFVNHATVLIQRPDLTILTDPVWAQRASPVSFAGPKRVRAPGLPLESLPKIDLILVSHNHYDHMDATTLKWLEEKFAPQVLCALGDRSRLIKWGLRNVTEFDWWESAKVGAGTEVDFLPTQHFSSRSLFDRNRALWGSFLIRTPAGSIYFGGDAGYSSHYAEIFRRKGAVDLGLIPIGAYAPQWFMQPIHMNPEEAVRAHLDLQARRSVGIHFGTFQLTEEEIDEPARRLEAALKAQGLAPDAFIVPREGVTTIYRM